MPISLPIELGEARALGKRRFRNAAYPVAVFELAHVSASARAAAIDPVCRMQVEIAHAIATIAHAGATHHFCSLKCADEFAKAPELYVGSG